jgi:hypothetical protein
MMRRAFSKTYLAIVTPGPPEPKGGAIETALRRVEAGREAYMQVCAADHPDAEAARSRYKTLKSAPGAALLQLDPETGRMHQLRVHLASVGRPIAGDARYGGALVVGGHAIPRLMLHATALGFPHPSGGTKRLKRRRRPTWPGSSARLGAGLSGTAPSIHPFRATSSRKGHAFPTGTLSMRRLILGLAAAALAGRLRHAPTLYQPSGPRRRRLFGVPDRARPLPHHLPRRPRRAAAAGHDYALLRAADLALADGYDWFRVSDRFLEGRPDRGPHLSSASAAPASAPSAPSASASSQGSAWAAARRWPRRSRW